MKIGDYEIQVPFVTTSSDNLKTVIELANIKPGERIVDLGSGDGRVILAFGKLAKRYEHEQKSVIHGFEIKPELVIRTNERIVQAGLQDIVSVYQKSFWDVDLSQYDRIYIYGMQSILGRLERKLEQEMRPGALFISNIFKLPHWKPKKKESDIYLYTK
jgi:cyclopropane fatty-acyl-phospholipid synthase-like methyltransferase